MLGSSLISFWREFRESEDNIHEGDRQCRRERDECPKELRTHWDLLPQPYLGDLATADVFVVYLNPGYDPGDDKWNRQSEFRKALLGTIRQEDARIHPFLFFDPPFSDHAGSNWWAGILGTTKTDQLCGRLAAVELYPYHSKKFAGWAWQRNLPSFVKAVDFVKSELIPIAQQGKICLVIVRGLRYLQPVAARENLVIYTGMPGEGAPIGGYLTPNTPGGKAIKAWLHAHPRDLCT